MFAGESAASNISGMCSETQSSYLKPVGKSSFVLGCSFFFKETSRRKRHVYLCFLQVFSHCRQIYQRPINFVFAGVGFPAWTFQVYNCVPNIRLATGYGDRCVGMSSAPLGENVKRKEIKYLNTIRWTECYFSGIMLFKKKFIIAQFARKISPTKFKRDFIFENKTTWKAERPNSLLPDRELHWFGKVR